MSGVRLHSYDMLWHICWLALAAPATVIKVYVVCALTYTQIRWHQWLRDVPGPARETWLMGNLRTFMYRDIGAVCRAWTQTFGGAVRSQYRPGHDPSRRDEHLQRTHDLGTRV